MKPAWRTVVVAIVGVSALTGGLALIGLWPVAVASYPAFAGGIGFCVGAVAAKAYGEHKANASAAEPPK